MAQDKVMISYNTGEVTRRPDFYDYVNMLEKPEGSALLPCHERSPAHGRNLIIYKAQELGYTHVLFIDDDMTFESHFLNKILENGHLPIVSGLYLSRQFPHAPVIFDLADDDGSCCPMYLIDKVRLKPIVAAGFGFLLIRMEVFEKLEKPYVRLGELPGASDQWCDDIGFFNRVRKANIPAYCDLEVNCGHMGTMIVKPVFKDGQWFTEYDTGNPQGSILFPQVSPKPQYEFKEA